MGIIDAGGAHDFGAAEASFLKGAALGHRGCEFQLGILYAIATPVADDIKAFGWLSLSLYRQPPVEPDVTKDLLDKVKRRLRDDQKTQQAEAYFADLQTHYGRVAAFQP